MLRRFAWPIAGFLAIVLPFLTACGGGGSSTAAFNPVSTFKLFRCSLGCSGGTCAINEIATNQSISITFNDTVQASSANFSTISIVERTTGTTPPGQFIVNGREVIFRPALIETSSGVRFGFTQGAEYEIKLFADPESSVVRSTIGRPNTTPISCVVRTTGVIDQVPGGPIATVTPNDIEPPLESSFVIKIVFDDLMAKQLLVDDFTGQSPTIKVFIEDNTQPAQLDIEVNGTFDATLDQDALTTTVCFTALTAYPGNAQLGGTPRRKVRVELSNQIVDLAGLALLNSGSFDIPLLQSTPTSGDFLEHFTSEAQQDPGGSTAGLWGALPSYLDSGLDPVSGGHKGGGSGVLGVFAPSTSFEFDTDEMTFDAEDTLIGEEVTVMGGVFVFEEILISSNVVISAKGSNPLRLFSRGQFVIGGRIDLSGISGDLQTNAEFPNLSAHPGKWTDPDELVEGTILNGQHQTREPNGGFDPNSRGASGALGTLTAGDGGNGGSAWYNFRDPDPAGDYYDEAIRGFKQDGEGANPDRYTDYMIADRAAGFSGQGVGGVASTGRPVDNPDLIETDRDNGAGLGSWNWPPVSNYVETNPSFPGMGSGTDYQIAAHVRLADGLFDRHAIHRSRGGGGGGYWTDGDPGVHYFAGAVDGEGTLLSSYDYIPVAANVDAVTDIWEYNSLFDFNERRAFGNAVADASGGMWTPPSVDFATLDPDMGYLLGGSGGGGAGGNQHGSWNNFARDDPSATQAMHTYRSMAGAAGGAGGGAGQIQAGGRLALTGQIRADGGAGGSSRFMVDLPGPLALVKGRVGVGGGGGGSGGALLVQVAGDPQIGNNSIYVLGGEPGQGDAGNWGGAGGSGVIRFETCEGPPGNPSQALSDLQGMVQPDLSVDRAPVGEPGVANWGTLSATIPDAGDTGVFNANASGVRSLWFEPPTANLVFLAYDSYEIRIEYSDGTTPGVLVYNVSAVDNNSPTPGVDPIWVAFQTGWGLPASPGDPSFPDPSTLSDWIIPGTTGLITGAQQIQALNSRVSRLLRFQLVFDQDLVLALIGSDPGAYFRVDYVDVNWVGE